MQQAELFFDTSGIQRTAVERGGVGV